MLLRWQLAFPEQPIPLIGRLFSFLPNGIILPELFTALGAMHGTIMVFLAVVPLSVGGFGTLLVPKMIGAANMAFPRLNKTAYWIYLLAGALMLSSFVMPGGAANSGWTSYPPLAILATSGQTAWLLGITVLGISVMLGAISMIVTIIGMRVPGMTMMRLPFFVWTQLITAFLLLLAFPALLAASVMQLADRLIGTSFFLPSGLMVSGQALSATGGGNPLLWQHLFWFLAHPEVYVLILPAMGIVAEILANNIRKPLWGYRLMVGAVIFLGGMSLFVWAHHMFLTGMGMVLSAFFQATTILIAIPSSIIMTSFLLSLWGGSIRFTTPMLFALGFIPMFALGGLAGIPLGIATTDVPLHDTFYVVGHFHYMVAPGTLMALFGGIYYWFAYLTGRRLNDTLGKWHFWLSFILFNVTFFPMLIQGLAGVSRRLYDGGRTYEYTQHVQFLHEIISVSVWLLALVQLLFIYNVIASFFKGKLAGQNPWDSTTLEWQHRMPEQVFRGPYEYAGTNYRTQDHP